MGFSAENCKEQTITGYGFNCRINILHSMARQLTREDVATRLKNYQRDGSLYIGGFVKSVTISAGTTR